MAQRSGLGYDVHRFAAGRDLIIGGVFIPFGKGLDGHSDADVLTHAIIDALLGAAALGDIGSHFPDTDPQYAGADSIALLETVAGRLDTAGYRIVNVDATVVLEKPKLSPFILTMRDRLAEAMGVQSEAVSVKATTSEKLGFIGAGEGAAALATCSIVDVDG